MPRISLPMAEWQAIAHELTGGQTVAVPPGVVERINALLAQAPSGWPEQIFALELDESSAEAVRSVQASLHDDDHDDDLGGGQRAASVAEAMQIIWDHQQHDEGSSGSNPDARL
jgi:hypothetical protein